MSHSWDKSTSHVCMIYLSSKVHPRARGHARARARAIQRGKCKLKSYSVYSLSLTQKSVYICPSYFMYVHLNLAAISVIFLGILLSRLLIYVLSYLHYLRSLPFIGRLCASSRDCFFSATRTVSPVCGRSDVTPGSRARRWPTAVHSNGQQ